MPRARNGVPLGRLGFGRRAAWLNPRAAGLTRLGFSTPPLLLVLLLILLLLLLLLLLPVYLSPVLLLHLDPYCAFGNLFLSTNMCLLNLEYLMSKKRTLQTLQSKRPS